MQNVHVFAIFAVENYEGSRLLSIWTDLGLALEEAKRLTPEAWADYITVRTLPVNKAADWDESTLVETFKCPTWEEKRLLERRKESEARLAEMMGQQPVIQDRRLRARRTDVAEIREIVDICRHDTNYRKERAAKVRAYNRAVRRDGKRIAREFIG